MSSSNDPPPPDDLNRLAEQFIDLWQDQLAALAADPALADTLTRFWAPAAWAMAPKRPERARDETAPHTAPSASQPANGEAAPAAGPAPAAAASGLDGGELGELLRRFASLEQRIAALEAGVRRRGSQAEPSPRRRRP